MHHINPPLILRGDRPDRELRGDRRQGAALGHGGNTHGGHRGPPWLRAQADRKLRPGELIEVREWMRKDEPGALIQNTAAFLWLEVGKQDMFGTNGT